jgi:hypothetical protein
MTDRAVGSLSIEVEVACVIPGDDQEDYCFINLVADSEYNNGQTCFNPGEKAYFRLYKAQTAIVKATSGSPVRIDRNAGEIITDEYVTFSGYDGSTSKPMFAKRSARWVGAGIGSVKFVRNTTQIYVVPPPDPGFGVGVLKLTYESQFDRYSISSPEEGDIIVYAYGVGACADTISTLTFQFRDECAVGSKEVTVVAKDAVTGNTIAGAYVYIDDDFKGITNSSGTLYVGTLTVGTHTIRITATGYQNTSSDGLANDSFVVSE